MKENKRIEKELLFKNNIKDITSISLDSDYKVNNKEILGNFLITGDYKIHEVSINREKFNFKIPFKHELENDIDETTVKLEITNFEYDYNKDELIVNIEYDITGDRKDVLIFNDEESLDNFLSSREVEVIDTRINDIKEEITKEENKEQKDKNTKEEQEEQKVNKLLNEDTVLEERTIEKETRENKLNLDITKNTTDDTLEEREIKTDEIINNVGKIEDSYVTYKVYKVNSNETLESIVIKYHTTIDELKEYNDLNNLSINDKIIIPYYE